ncbi:hypothetical protein SASPL_125856 [Salvia splendens]|uniref:Vacuolar protein sorting-associated protein 26C n=1 Tax=Salvia splendens TaxID=180675 RepID=A0A8X8XID6_SALSN|nr:hypothetical protein SASPL_125856 [Salvia splendens]
MSVEIKLSRFNRIYRPGELLEGKIITTLNSSISYQSIRLTLNGTVNLQVRAGSAGVIDFLYGVIKPIPIMKKVVDVRSSGKIGSGTTEIPFSVILKDPKEKNLGKFYETFHGGNISIQYLATVDIARGYLHKPLSATIEYIVESDKDNLPQKPIPPEMVIFYITQDTQRHTLISELKSDPINGELTVEASAVPIRSIDIHLLRVESILIGERIATESSVMQETQAFRHSLDYSVQSEQLCIIKSGNRSSLNILTLTRPIKVQKGFSIRKSVNFKEHHFTYDMKDMFVYAPFSIEFKLSIVITFESDLYKKPTKADPVSIKPWMATESMPLELVHTT